LDIKLVFLKNFLSDGVFLFFMIIGVVGKANVGKSTFFKASTLAEVEISDRPFVTIKPNHGTAYVKVDCACRDFGVKCEPRLGFCIDGERFVGIDMLDVAGLIPGAYRGAGLGNQFLDELRQADVLVHIVDISGGTNIKGEKVDSFSHDPCEDVEFLEHEMNMWYFGIVKKGWNRFVRRVKQENLQIQKEIAKQLSGLGVCENDVNEGISETEIDKDFTMWSDEELLKLSIFLRRRNKPMIIAANKIDIEGSEKNLERLKEKFPDYLIIPCSSESELALREAAKHNMIDYVAGAGTFKVKSGLSDAQKKALDRIQSVLEKWGDTGVQQVLNTGIFDILDYVAVFPVSNNKLTDSKARVLPDCLLLKKGSTALDLAYAVHTSIGEHFIRAIDIRTKRVVGRNYKLKDRDVIEIVSEK